MQQLRIATHRTTRDVAGSARTGTLRRAAALLLASLLAALVLAIPAQAHAGPAVTVVGPYVLDTSTVANIDGGPTVTIAPPALMLSGDLLVAYVLGPPAQPDAPIAASDAGWTALPEVLHLARFVRTWLPTDPSTYTFTWSPGAPATTIMATLVAVHGPNTGIVVGSAGQPVCQKAADTPCSGAWHGNLPQVDPAFPAPATNWRATSVGALTGDLVLVGYYSHNTAKSATFSSPCAAVLQGTSANRPSGNGVGGYQGICAFVMTGDGLSPTITATPSGATWQHTMATVTVLR